MICSLSVCGEQGGRETTGDATRGAGDQRQRREELASETVFLDPPDFIGFGRPDHRRMEAAILIACTLLIRKIPTENSSMRHVPR